MLPACAPSTIPGPIGLAARIAGAGAAIGGADRALHGATAQGRHRTVVA
jgi:hypothetical protein